MIRLHRLLRSHPEALEADLVRFAGAPTSLDLVAATAGRRWTVSVRWLLRRLRHIPHGQGAAIHTLEGPEWSAEADLLDELRRWYRAVHTESHEDPGPHPRNPAATTTSTSASSEVVAHVARLRAEREAAIAAGDIP